MAAGLLELLAPSICPGCDVSRREGELLLCPRCAAGLGRLDELGGVATAIAYRGVGAKLVQRFKYAGRADALACLLDLFARRLERLAFDCIVAVPRHPERVRALSCEPAHDLARALGRRTGVALADRVLYRDRPTRTQTGLDLEGRRRNVAGCFRARPGALRGRAVLLVDDVVTTGATLSEAAAALVRVAAPRRLQRAAVAGTPIRTASQLDPRLPSPPPAAL